MMKNAKLLGQFECTTGVLVISDPCYDLDTWCMGEIEKAKKGIWKAFVVMNDSGGWGVRCAELIALHEELSPQLMSQLYWEKSSIDVGVDSGQAGIFDKSSFKNDSLIKEDPHFSRNHANEAGERWYAACCDITLSDDQAGVLPGGAVSSSGYGDGMYDCFIVKKGDEVVGVKIVFIGDDEDEDEEDLFEEDYDDEEDFDDEDEDEDADK